MSDNLIKENEESRNNWNIKGFRTELRKRLINDEGGLDEHDLLQTIIHMARPELRTMKVREVANKALEEFESIGHLLFKDVKRLEAVTEFDARVTLAIKVIAGAALRVIEQEAAAATRSSSVKATMKYFHAKLAWQEVESCGIIHLNKRKHVIAYQILATGTVNHCPVYPREVARLALKASAKYVIMLHNHPSGDPSPSRDDIVMTRQISQALSVLDITLYDHVVVGSRGTFSFLNNGLL